MEKRLLVQLFAIALLVCVSEGHYGKSIVVCPISGCPFFYMPWYCRAPTYFYHFGRLCRGCDQDICHGGIYG